jgi:hypothetical protein
MSHVLTAIRTTIQHAEFYEVLVMITELQTFEQRFQTIHEAYFLLLFACVDNTNVGRDSSVGKAYRFGMDGLEIESRWRQYFPHLSRPGLGPIQMVPDPFRG